MHSYSTSSPTLKSTQDNHVTISSPVSPLTSTTFVPGSKPAPAPQSDVPRRLVRSPTISQKQDVLLGRCIACNGGHKEEQSSCDSAAVLCKTLRLGAEVQSTEEEGALQEPPFANIPREFAFEAPKTERWSKSPGGDVAEYTQQWRDQEKLRLPKECEKKGLFVKPTYIETKEDGKGPLTLKEEKRVISSSRMLSLHVARPTKSVRKTLLKQREKFEGIHLDLSKQPGSFRCAESGLGWKPAGSSNDSSTFTLDSKSIQHAGFSRASKGWELKVMTKDDKVIQFDGFEQEDFDRLSKAFKVFFGITLSQTEHALRGWNWGKTDFTRSELVFNIQNRPAFELPYSEIANTNLAGKNEIAVEFNLGDNALTNGTNGETNGTNGHTNGEGKTKNRGRKAAAARDELVEMRFYIPGTITKKANGDAADGSDADEKADDGEGEENAAQYFYDTLVDRADIGDVAGSNIATFPDVLHLTPRGRFDIDLYTTSLRLRGKSYDYKILYENIKKFFMLPKNDEVHSLLVL
ncbi:FACT complex subunit, partial [Elasticomyces elasticus]